MFKTICQTIRSVGKNFFVEIFSKKKMEKAIISKILIVGCGLTGSVTANLIEHEAKSTIEIWEKEEFIGGRFRTFRTGSGNNCSVDLGAQYVTATLDIIRSQARFYDELLDTDQLIPLGQKIENFRKLSESKMNFVAPGGTVSLIQHFLEKTNAKIYHKHDVRAINMEKEKKVWEVKASNGVTKEFDAVILTIPVPEILKLEGDFQDLNADEDVKMAMEQVKFASRYAVALMYNTEVKALHDLKWSMKFFPDNDVICFISVDNRKRGKFEEPPAILIHTTTKFMLTSEDMNEDQICNIVFEETKCLIPELPEPQLVKCVQWSNSQVIDAYIDNPGCIVLNDHPCLISGGDSYTESNFNGCITSALRIVEELLKNVSIAKGCKLNHARKSN